MADCKIFHEVPWAAYPGGAQRAIPRCQTHNCTVLATPGRCIVGALEDLADRLERHIESKKATKQ